MGFWETLGINIIGCSLTATLALIAATWRFQTEKWFTLKTSTYMEILKALHLIKKHTNLLFMDCGASHIDDFDEDLAEHYENHKQTQELPKQKEQRKKIERMQEEAEFEIDKHIDLGTFIVKKEAIGCLMKLKNSYDSREHEDYDNYIVRLKKTTDDCYDEIKKIATEDLEKNWTWG